MYIAPPHKNHARRLVVSVVGYAMSGRTTRSGTASSKSKSKSPEPKRQQQVPGDGNGGLQDQGLGAQKTSSTAASDSAATEPREQQNCTKVFEVVGAITSAGGLTQALGAVLQTGDAQTVVLAGGACAVLGGAAWLYRVFCARGVEEAEAHIIPIVRAAAK